MNLKYENIKPKIGAKVLNTKAELLSGVLANDIRELLEQTGVVVFPEIHFSDAEQVEFTKTLGKFAFEGSREEKVHNISLDTTQNASADYLLGSMFWHIDGTMNDVPILASLLGAKVLSQEGGKTEFCNTYAAYDDLSSQEKAEYDNLSVLHGVWPSLFYYDPEPNIKKLQAMMAVGENELPLVWEHKSGRKSLVLGCTAGEVIGKSHRESAELLVKLRNWATQPDYVYSHDWSIGDLVMWDNTGTMHRATKYDPKSGRLLVRTKLEGEEPIRATA